MACFIVPAAEAVVTTVVTKVLEKREKTGTAGEQSEGMKVEELRGEHLSDKLRHLNGLLWGGSALLAFEHVWHGEVQPFFPFLTAAADPEDMAEMLHEMSTVGVGMAALVTVVWGVMTLVTMRRGRAPRLAAARIRREESRR